MRRTVFPVTLVLPVLVLTWFSTALLSREPLRGHLLTQELQSRHFLVFSQEGILIVHDSLISLNFTTCLPWFSFIFFLLFNLSPGTETAASLFRVHTGIAPVLILASFLLIARM